MQSCLVWPAPAPFPHGSPGHTKQLCIACHAAVVHVGAPGVTAAPANSMPSCFTCHPDGTKNCSYCHKPRHANRGPCQNCHNLGAWTGGKNFAHPQPLIGKHAQISCQTCHTQGVSVKPDGCITCHGDQHNGLKNCVDCHQLTGWIPSTFRHPQEGPHVPNGDEKLQCNACHLNGFGQKASCPCHGNNPPTGGLLPWHGQLAFWPNPLRWQALHCSFSSPLGTCGPSCGCLKVLGIHPVSWWQSTQFLRPLCWSPWQVMQPSGFTETPCVWQVWQEICACLPISGCG